MLQSSHPLQGHTFGGSGVLGPIDEDTPISQISVMSGDIPIPSRATWFLMIPAQLLYNGNPKVDASFHNLLPFLIFLAESIIFWGFHVVEVHSATKQQTSANDATLLRWLHLNLMSREGVQRRPACLVPNLIGPRLGREEGTLRHGKTRTEN